ncbi:hypothetical protein LIER_26369 [Lithospermum erythrorhizon]|uniref:Uncharacterized protein n=1 Tax=Lithospermum erythrorhizon TaxID=34254 RepID=A0AAV3R9E4_LITER
MAGGGILRDTPSPPPTNGESPIRIVNAATLNQVRFYTSVGAEVLYGDLGFTPYQDPFANMALKQEEENDDVFREINNYPANPPALGNIMDESQSFPTGSSTPMDILSSIEGSVSQPADDQGANSFALPAFIKNALLVPFMNTQLWDFKEYFSIPEDVGIRVPVEGESILEPTVNEGETKRAFYPG